METLSVWMGDLGAYNAGKLRGNWYALSDYGDPDEFWEAVREDLPGAEEIVCFDHEHGHGLVSESGNNWELLFLLSEALDADDTLTIAAIHYANDHYSSPTVDNVEEAKERHRWTGTAEEYGEDVLDCESVPDHLRDYFDAERYGEAMLAGSPCYEVDGTKVWFD